MSMEDNTGFPIPPATFGFLVESILMQAQIQLGLLRFGEEEPEEPNLPLARHSIDILAVLQEKTRGNLSAEEMRLLENGLTELRFRYVQVADELKQKPPDAAANAEGESLAAPASASEPRIVTADGGKGTRSMLHE